MPPGYPWATGDALLAADLNAAIVSASSGVASGGPFLPLSGGTVARHMAGTATNSNLTINATALGSGSAGPLTAQIGLSINLAKDGWFTGTSAVGEIDGLVIGCRQGGTTSDCGGILINVQGTGAGFLAIDESVVQQIAPNTGAVLYSIRTQEGGMDPVGATRIGKNYIADKGNMTSAIRVSNTLSQGYWGHALEVTRDGAMNLVMDDTGNITAAGATAGFLNLRATGSVYLRGDTSVSIAYDGTNNGIQLNLGGSIFEYGGGGTVSIFGSQVLRYRVTGWGAATGTATRSTFATSSVTLPQLAEHVKALIDDLMTHGMIGT